MKIVRIELIVDGSKTVVHVLEGETVDGRLQFDVSTLFGSKKMDIPIGVRVADVMEVQKP